MLTSAPGIDEIRQAAERIKPFIHQTPVLTSESINKITGSNILFKCENLQKAGSFKIRGASNAVFSLTDVEASRGVATHSSGNFAQALALAARTRGIRADIVMPRTSPKAKKDAVEAYGGKITLCEPTLEARESTLAQIVEAKGSTFLHPYNNYDVIAGQGTSALELIEDYACPDIIIAPVGGGGLLSGTALASKALCPKIKVIAAEPLNADDARRSFFAGYIIPSQNPKTIADGLLTSLGSRTFPIIREYVDDIATVSEEYIIMAMKLIWVRMKIIVEPSAAVPLGAILESKIKVNDTTVAIILSGGNLDLNRLPW